MADERTFPTTAAPEQIFRSAVGWPACGQILLCAWTAALSVLLLTGSWPYGAFAAVLLVVAVATPVWLLVGTTYRIGDGNLVVSTLYRRRRIALADITAVKRWPHWQYPVRSSEDFALCSTRILICYADSRVFVSPRDERGFLAALGRPIAS
ncbi:MAG: PH domain-containing protein [Pseudomonadales bacterium]|nr:PH domain-containing protein [Pseudomonadales bacterium]